MECSLDHAKQFKFVVVCDISEFYPRLGHHRPRNHASPHPGAALCAFTPDYMSFLKNYSNTNSLGLPVGGPAARVLSELVLNQIDRLLEMEGVTFCRFADDFHVFWDIIEAYARLIFLSEKLLRTQGLQLQKSKTRIMSSAEFAATNPLSPTEGDSDANQAQDRAKGLMQLSLRFDPYSPTRSDDYATLKAEIERFDILGLLRDELLKSRVHIGLNFRKIVAAVKYLESKARDDAITTMVDNAELLYPIFSGVLTVARSVFDDISPEAQTRVHQKIIELIEGHSHVLRVDLNLAFALRVLACRHSPEAEAVLARIFKLSTSSTLLRRDVILIMAKWKEPILGPLYRHHISDRSAYQRGELSSLRRSL